MRRSFSEVMVPKATCPSYGAVKFSVLDLSAMHEICLLLMVSGESDIWNFRVSVMAVGVFTFRYCYERGLVALFLGGVIIARSSAYVSMSPVPRHHSVSPIPAPRSLPSSPLWMKPRPSQRPVYKVRLSNRLGVLVC